VICKAPAGIRCREDALHPAVCHDDGRADATLGHLAEHDIEGLVTGAPISTVRGDGVITDWTGGIVLIGRRQF